MRDVKYSLQLLHFATILARHDATFVFDVVKLPFPARAFLWLITKRNRKTNKGVRLAAALQKMGPSFIKFGQALSTRADLIGVEIAEGLAQLQDKLPAFDGSVAKAIVEAELGDSIENLFTWFEHDATAAASIAQVHFATTKEGKDVAVKVLRPNIEAAFARDFELLYWLAEKVAKRLPRLRPVEVVRTLEETIRIELDLRFEAAAAEELKQNTKHDPEFYVVEVDWQRTAKRVLTTERIRGFHASDKAGMEAAGIDVTKITEKAATAFFNQVFRDGFFHADMHPGNLFVLPDGRLAPVDFGIMGRIDRAHQIILAEILYGFLKGDYQKVAQVHYDAGWIPPHVSVDVFAQAARAIGQPMMGKALSEISFGRLLGQLIQIAQQFEMIAQPQLILLQKTMVTAEGVGRGLNPNVNMWQLAEPLITEWAHENFSPRAKLKTLACEALEVIKEAPQVLKELREYFQAAQARQAV